MKRIKWEIRANGQLIGEITASTRQIAIAMAIQQWGMQAHSNEEIKARKVVS